MFTMLHRHDFGFTGKQMKAGNYCSSAALVTFLPKFTGAT